MSAPGAGYEYPTQEVSWQKRDVLLFANSIGIKADELHFLYVRPPGLPRGPCLEDQCPNPRTIGAAPQLRRLSHLLSYPAYAPQLLLLRVMCSRSLTLLSSHSLQAHRPGGDGFLCARAIQPYPGCS